MIKFDAYYHLEGEVIINTTDDWNRLPCSDLLFVDITVDGYRHRLLGADFYWFKNNRYGMIHDGSCSEEGYHSWIIKDNIFYKDEIPYKPKENEARFLVGKMLPDDEWYTLLREY